MLRTVFSAYVLIGSVLGFNPTPMAHALGHDDPVPSVHYELTARDLTTLSQAVGDLAQVGGYGVVETSIGTFVIDEGTGEVWLAGASGFEPVATVTPSARTSRDAFTFRVVASDGSGQGLHVDLDLPDGGEDELVPTAWFVLIIIVIIFAAPLNEGEDKYLPPPAPKPAPKKQQNGKAALPGG